MRNLLGLDLFELIYEPLITESMKCFYSGPTRHLFVLVPLAGNAGVGTRVEHDMMMISVRPERRC
jgi:hypothetical protein